MAEMSERTERDADRSVHAVAFAIEDADYPFVAASETESCTFELAEMVPRGDGQYAEFFNVIGVDPARIFELAEGSDLVEASLVEEYDDGGLFEFRVAGGCPAVTLAELGALPRTVRAEDGEGRIVAEIPPQCDPGPLIEAFLAEVPDAELVSKREKESVRPLFSTSAFRPVLQSRLTDRQQTVLRAAYEAGYYEWPRECTGADVAEDLGIASATFSEHLQAAERKLLALLFEDAR